jgi:hypothetical protein
LRSRDAKEKEMSPKFVVFSSHYMLGL